MSYFYLIVHIHFLLMQHKLTLQEQMIKQLRKQQKELKESSGAMTNQKSIFRVSYVELNHQDPLPFIFRVN